VYGPQGSGKTLDLLTPALLAAPGAALVTLTKLGDLLLSLDRRAAGGRPVAVLDPVGVAAGVPEVVWDPVAGCVDSLIAERRAKAFTAGTVRGAVAGGAGDDAARFYAAEGAKVLQAFFHAAALTGRTLDHVLEWVADPRNAFQPEEILRTHPRAERFWDGCCAERCMVMTAPRATRRPRCSSRWRCSSRPRCGGGAFPLRAGRPPTSRT